MKEGSKLADGNPEGKSLGKALISTSTTVGEAEASRAVGEADASRAVGDAEPSAAEGSTLGVRDGASLSTTCRTQTSEVANGRQEVLLSSPSSSVVH